jgi:hypothetical protein
VIQLRAAIRKVLAGADQADPQLAAAVREVLTRDDDYATVVRSTAPVSQLMTAGSGAGSSGCDVSWCRFR